MKKKVKFSIKMRQDVEVRNLEELRQNFSLTRVLVYMSNGKLVKWLRNGYMNDIADKIEALDENDSEIERKIFEIFDIEYDKQKLMESEKEEKKQKKLNELKKYTNDKKFKYIIDNIAFTQSELYDLLDKGETEIFLCGDKFEIPINIRGRIYCGINNPIVFINSKKIISYANMGVLICGVRYDDEYQNILNELNESQESEKLQEKDILEVNEFIRKNGELIKNLILLRKNILYINDFINNKEIILRENKFSIEKDLIYGNPSMLLIYEYDKLSFCGHIIISESNLYLGDWDDMYGNNDSLKDVKVKENASREFVKFCRIQDNKEYSYNFIFWAIMIFLLERYSNTEEINKKEEFSVSLKEQFSLSLIDEFAKKLEILDDEMTDILYVVVWIINQVFGLNVSKQEIGYIFKTESIPYHFRKVLEFYKYL